jgi:hypothetical protein
MLVATAAPVYAGRELPITTTPEPATMALMAGGLALVGALAWRRNRKG